MPAFRAPHANTSAVFRGQTVNVDLYLPSVFKAVTGTQPAPAMLRFAFFHLPPSIWPAADARSRWEPADRNLDDFVEAGLVAGQQDTFVPRLALWVSSSNECSSKVTQRLPPLLADPTEASHGPINKKRENLVATALRHWPYRCPAPVRLQPSPRHKLASCFIKWGCRVQFARPRSVVRAPTPGSRGR